MATTVWSSLIATLALAWCLSATAGGVPLLAGKHKSHWMQHTPDRLDKEKEELRRQPISSHSVVKRFSRPDTWEETLERLSSSGITPAMLKELLREGSQWPARNPASKRGQKEVNNDGTTGGEVAKWKEELDNSLRHGNKKRWLDLFGGSSVETRFPLPERRQFPEVDWRGFNEDVFHESFGDFNPMKRWKRSSRKV